MWPPPNRLEYEAKLQRDDPAPWNDSRDVAVNLLVTWLLFVGFVLLLLALHWLCGGDLSGAKVLTR